MYQTDSYKKGNSTLNNYPQWVKIGNTAEKMLIDCCEFLADVASEAWNTLVASLDASNNCTDSMFVSAKALTSLTK